MNLVDAYVTKVLDEPVFVDTWADEGLTWWQVPVEYNAYGRIGETTLSFQTEEEAKNVREGYHFLC